MNAVEFKNVSYSYDGQTLALDGVTLSIAQGSFVCILGGNGSGKSTLARHVDALLLPDAGEVQVVGLDTSDSANLFEVRRSAGLVFQNPDDQIVAAVVEDDVAFGPENIGVPSSELPGRVQEALGRVGLQGFAKRETFALSGGQKQRVAIAGACAMDPRIIVFDEAASMLDPRGRRGLMRLCRELNDAGMTIVLITHFMEEAAGADRVIVLDRGAVAMDGAPDEVLSQARQLQGLDLEAPFAVQMSMALQDAGVLVDVCVEEERLEQQLQRLGMAAGAGCDGDAGGEGAAEGEGPSGEGEGPGSEGEGPGSEGPVRANCLDGRVAGEPATARAAEATPSCATAVEGEAIMSLRNVGFSYAGKGAAVGLQALKDVSFSLNEGDFLGIAGHTGSGKSTLVQLMAALLQPTVGEVLARGRNLADKRNTEEIRRAVGMVFQYPEHQLFAPTVFEDVAFGPRNLGLSQEDVAERVREALRLVRLDADEVGGKSPFALSGGQQRRVALAGVLAMRPRVLILDEPTAGLDPCAHGRLLDLIAELHEASNVATVMVSHNMDDLAKLCNRVLLLNRGEVVADGAPATIFSDEEAIRGIGLGVPHTVHLAHVLGLGGCFCGIPTIPELAAQVAERWQGKAPGERPPGADAGCEPTDGSELPPDRHAPGADAGCEPMDGCERGCGHEPGPNGGSA